MEAMSSEFGLACFRLTWWFPCIREVRPSDFGLLTLDSALIRKFFGFQCDRHYQKVFLQLMLPPYGAQTNQRTATRMRNSAACANGVYSM